MTPSFQNLTQATAGLLSGCIDRIFPAAISVSIAKHICTIPVGQTLLPTQLIPFDFQSLILCSENIHDR